MNDMTATIREETTTVKGRHYARWTVDFGNIRGKRERKSFSSKQKAERWMKRRTQELDAWSERQETLSRKIGEKAERWTADNLLDATKGVELLGGRASIEQAARFYLQHTQPLGGERTVNALLQ